MRPGALARVALALGLLAASGPVRAGEPRGVVIEAGRLEPSMLQTTVGQRVNFVNRSGRAIHLEFPRDGGRHQVFQVPQSVWAVFHRPGRHAYVVHFLSVAGRELHGVVDVEPGEGLGPEPPVCTTISVMGVCLEP